jgi:L-rhamnose mutarotase
VAAAGGETETLAFRMTLHPGQADEYKRRHDAIWPELVEALRSAGVVDYRIYLDPATHQLFAVLTRRTDHGMDALPDTPVMRRWWAMMADIMQTGQDLAPETAALVEVFRLETPRLSDA